MFVRLRSGQAVPATYCSSTPRHQHPAVAWWHAHLRGIATAIEAPCSALAGPKRNRESSKCEVLKPFYCSALANPVRLWRTGGICSLEHFHEISGLVDHREQADWTPQQRILRVNHFPFCCNAMRFVTVTVGWLCGRRSTASGKRWTGKAITIM